MLPKIYFKEKFLISLPSPLVIGTTSTTSTLVAKPVPGRTASENKKRISKMQFSVLSFGIRNIQSQPVHKSTHGVDLETSRISRFISRTFAIALGIIFVGLLTAKMEKIKFTSMES